MGLMTSKESDAKLFIGQDGYYYVSPGQKQPVRGPATKEVEDTPKENSPDKKDRRNQMVSWLPEFKG